MIGVSRGSCEGSKNRWLRLLDLQEQRSFVVGQEQADRAERADAADPDDFEGDVLKMIAPQQYAPILLQCLGIGDEGLACIELMAAQMAHERRLVSDAPTAADLLHEAKMVLPCRKHAGKLFFCLRRSFGGSTSASTAPRSMRTLQASSGASPAKYAN